MGMFDYVQCDYPLPDGRVVDGPVFQTKDFDCGMDIVRISRAGRLVLREWHFVDVPKAERPYPDAEEGSIESMCGIVRRVVDREYEAEFHGDMNFYGEPGDFIARFTEGQLQWIKPLTLSPESPNEGAK